MDFFKEMERLKTQMNKKISSCTLMQHYPFPSGFPLLLEITAFSPQQNIARRRGTRHSHR